MNKMPSFVNIFLLTGILYLNEVLSLPDPAISQKNSRNLNTLQSFTKSKPTEINSLQDTDEYHRQYNVEPLLDIKTTLEQVQNMLERDPTLPRLTRGEIEDLFEQVTKEEYDKSVKAGDYTRAKHMRALMLVLPFNTESISNHTLQELYNKPPVTKVIPSPELKPQKNQETIIPSGKVEIVAIDNSNVTPTTYKPAFRIKAIRKKQVNTPTTYRPNPEIMRTATTSSVSKNTKLSQLPELTTPTSPFQRSSKHPIKQLSNTRYSSHYNAKKSDFSKSSFTHKRGTTKFSLDDNQWQPKIPTIRTTTKITTTSTTTSKPKITPELEDILESLGFAAKSQSKKRFKLEDPTLDATPLPIMSSLIKQDPLGVEEFRPLPINLSADDFKKSLIPQTKPDDFVAFKPLPIADDTPESLKPELENYFKMFGLLPVSIPNDGDDISNSRSQKSLKLANNENKEKIVNSTLITSTLTNSTPTTTIKSIITTTLKRVDSKQTKKPINIKQVKQNNETSARRIDTNIDDSIGVGNDQDQFRSDEEDYIQLMKLLKNLRELQELNMNLTEDKLKHLDVKNYNLSETLLSQVGPDPIKESDPNDPLKNEIKRQNTGIAADNRTTDEPIRYNLELQINQNDDGSVQQPFFATTTTTTPVPITTTSTTTTTTTTQSSRSDSDGNLADSFSGGLGPVIDEQLPPPRRNGFYFLADWNSFLEVGEGDDQVVVRFSPKVGDASRFIPVKIP